MFGIGYNMQGMIMKMLFLSLSLLLSTTGFSAWEAPRLAARSGSQSTVVEVKSMDQLKSLINSGGTVFVDFYSPTCPPCKRLAPKYAEYSATLSSKGKFLKVNVYDVKGASEAYNVTGFPTMIVFENGREKERVIGMPDIPQYFERMK